MSRRSLVAVLISLVLAGSCRSPESGPADRTASPSSTQSRPSILLVTLDTTRADAIGPEARGIDTPGFNALAARGLRFRQAYATAPETLPSHSSMMTGLYPAGHGVHENARYLADTHPTLATQLKAAGYRTAAFVSSFILSRRFGLARGFDLYDDGLAPGQVERTSRATTDAAIAHLAQASAQPEFMWVHYFDPHTPYAPEGLSPNADARARYLGEVAVMDREMTRLIAGFESSAARRGSSPAIIISGDHGEGLGDHGELQHGNLLYQSTMHVPLLVVGPGVAPGTSDTPVSTRRIFFTVLDWAGIDPAHTLRGAEPSTPEVVLGEAMKPYFGYGWQPQIMAVAGRHKAIFAGTTEVYDLGNDPGETKNLGAGANLPAALRKALDDYPVPSPETARAPDNLSDEARRNLASLGYVSGGSQPIVRKDAPRPADMVGLFEILEKASGLFVQERYAEVIPLLEKIRAADPNNLDALLRLATAHSSLGHEAQALAAFKSAAAIAPQSPDVRTYLALHYARGKDWERAVPLLERIVADTPDRLPAVEALATVRERQGRSQEALALRQKIVLQRTPTAADLIRIGQLAMQLQQTALAIESFEKARALTTGPFANDLELGVLYLAARRFTDARDALDRIPPSHPEYAMALFKRAQVSVLLKEPDSAARIAQARAKADRTTRPLVESERLFR
jgi:arylsulfatase A-like enzyme/Flp pilus assembly protein TadD